MKKFWVVLLVLTLAAAPALAVTQQEAETLARQAVGDNAATLTRLKLDDGVFEIELSGQNARYEVDVLSMTGDIVELKTVYLQSAAGALTPEQAIAYASVIAPEAAQGMAFADRENGVNVYEVFYSTGSAVGKVTLNAQNGMVISFDRYPAAAAQGILSLEKAIAQIKNYSPQAEVTQMELSWDDFAYRLEGEALIGGLRYSYEMDAATGALIEWERDD